jgi:hypothetical protein
MMGWSIALSKTIVPAKDARDYLLNLPKARQEAAMAMAADGRGPILHATSGIGLVVTAP